jgi:formamidopyrimidine-DNA glycosylase
MPELPEVETIRRQIAADLEGQTILSAQVSRARAVRAHCSVDDFVQAVTGQTILAVRRRGKVLLLPLDNDYSLLIRLGMSGRVVVVDLQTAVAPHTHVVLRLSNAKELRYIDPRTFGQVAVVAGHDPARMTALSHYGIEPLSPAFTAAVLRDLLQGKHALVQAVLMDQSRIVGIGKIYADESCFMAGNDPRRRADSLCADEVERLHAAIRDVLSRAIEARGTSGQDGAYRDAHGSLGSFQQQLYVYQRDEQPCRICGTPVESQPFQGRHLHFCPHCQR